MLKRHTLLLSHLPTHYKGSSSHSAALTEPQTFTLSLNFLFPAAFSTAQYQKEEKEALGRKSAQLSKLTNDIIVAHPFHASQATVVLFAQF